VTQPSPCPLHSSKQQDIDAAACGLCPCTRKPSPATSLGRPTSDAVSSWSIVFTPGFASHLGASLTQQLRHKEISIDITLDCFFLEEKSSEWGVNYYKNTAI
jgi:hypothetical protein